MVRLQLSFPPHRKFRWREGGWLVGWLVGLVMSSYVEYGIGKTRNLTSIAGLGLLGSMTQLVMVEPEGPCTKKLLADRLSMDQQRIKQVEPVALTFG